MLLLLLGSKLLLLQHLLYALCGVGAVMTNTIIISAVLTHSYLRGKPVLQLICSLAVMDYIEGWSTMTAGIYRTIVRLLGYQDEQFSALQCMICLPWSYLWRISDFGTAFMLFALSADRILAVFRPLRYMAYGKTYSLTVIGLVYLCSIVFGSITAFYPMPGSNTTSMLCTTHYISPITYQASKYLSSTVSGFSVLLYVPISLKLWAHSSDMHSMGMNAQQYQMSWTVGISCFCTLFLDTLPRAIGVLTSGTIYSMEANPAHCESWMSHLFHLTKVNSMINFILYWKRSDLIRDAIKDVINDIRHFRLCCYEHRIKKISMPSHFVTTENQRLRPSSLRDLEEVITST
uniref:G_PROTEIN_RECEP_F1_2 domain-containing protein n=1 Tax=Syphacia muris TaxID=451379 RepID=A0A0N5AKX6_9BILA